MRVEITFKTFEVSVGGRCRRQLHHEQLKVALALA
jgi:hypothetical protein